MALTYLKIFADMEETLGLYSDEERGRLLSAMMAYSFRGEEPEFAGAERFVWPMLRNHIDSCEERSEKMKANGKRGGKAESKPEATESKAEQTEANKPIAKPSLSKNKNKIMIKNMNMIRIIRGREGSARASSRPRPRRHRRTSLRTAARISRRSASRRTTTASAGA